MDNFNSVAVLGLGKVGRLATRLLHDAGLAVHAHDLQPPSSDAPFDIEATDVSDPVALDAALGGVDAVLSCLPYHLNVGVAESAHQAGIHYFDLTEDVPTTARIRELAETGRA